MKLNIFIFLLYYIINAQIGIGNPNPNSDAILDLNSANNKGLLFPRMELVDRDSPDPLTAHIQGMVIYNTAKINDVNPGLYYDNGTKWNKITGDLDDTPDAFVNNPASSRIELATQSNGSTSRPAGTEFIITDSGNVGIGTSNPTRALHTTGDGFVVRSLPLTTNRIYPDLKIDPSNGVLYKGDSNTSFILSTSGQIVATDKTIYMWQEDAQNDSTVGNEDFILPPSGTNTNRVLYLICASSVPCTTNFGMTQSNGNSIKTIPAGKRVTTIAVHAFGGPAWYIMAKDF